MCMERLLCCSFFFRFLCYHRAALVSDVKANRSTQRTTNSSLSVPQDKNPDLLLIIKHRSLPVISLTIIHAVLSFFSHS